MIRSKEESDMKKWQKFLTLCLCGSMMMGTPTVLYAANTYAAQGVIVNEFTKQRYDVIYRYGNGGNTLKLEIVFSEQHTTTGQIYTDMQSDYAFGSETSVGFIRRADLGYEYTSLSAYGYLNYGSEPQSSFVNGIPSN